MLNTPKDNFSKQAAGYSKYRPAYPPELYSFIYAHVKIYDAVWDCATGNGQAAVELAKQFTNVYATDISEKQLANATTLPNIYFSLQRAEQTDFADHTFDLITIAQALHWFNFEAFYKEVNRLLKPGGVIAAWGYDVLSVSPEVDALFLHFYQHDTDPYWDLERKLIDARYTTIPFPFKRIETPVFEIKLRWTRNDFEGYLNTWSGVQNCIKQTGNNPVDKLVQQLQGLWGANEVKSITFPVFMLLGTT